MAIITHTFIEKSNTLFFEDKANLGRNPIKQLCNNVTNCFVTGILHNIGNTNVKC